GNISYNGYVTLKWYPSESVGKDMTKAVIYQDASADTWPNKTIDTGTDVTGTSTSGSLYSFTSTILAGVTTTKPYIIYTVGDVASPMPVELTSFVAKSDPKGVVLNWETATEVSNHGFDVERALVNADGKTGNFSKLGFVNGNGNSNSPKSYSFVDNKAVYGKYVYRLKQVDTDGKFEYSKNVEVEVKNLPASFVMDQNYPNPFNPSTTISFSVPKASFVNISVYNMLGQKVATIANEVMQEGAYERSFNSTNLSSGNYIYIMTSGNAKIVKKMTLVK
ncbi:MAG: T9SS type A sorting domain-containing protein, partial [Bacteroidota bacterium]|nr:T9SS type A sorting domain-containing protein [Bacteroidota bacterium]